MLNTVASGMPPIPSLVLSRVLRSWTLAVFVK